jgi:hypothetical protein
MSGVAVLWIGVGVCPVLNSGDMRPTKNKTIREAEPQKNWEDEYKRLQEKFIAQKQLLNEQEEHIKMSSTMFSFSHKINWIVRLHVKTRKIERAFTALERQQGGGESVLSFMDFLRFTSPQMGQRLQKLQKMKISLAIFMKPSRN